MNSELRLCWVMLGWSGLAFLAALGGCVMLDGTYGPSLYSILLRAPLTLVALLLGAVRIARIGSVGIWQFLPAGNRVFARALGIVVLSAVLVLGGLADLTNTHDHTSMPLSRTLASYVVLSCIGFVLLWNRGMRIPGFFAALLIAFFFVFRSFVGRSVEHHPGSSFWWLIAGLCTGGWLIAAFFERRPQDRARGSWMLRTSTATGYLLARARARILLMNSSARGILQAERRGLGRLSGALLLVLSWVLFQHWFMVYLFPATQLTVGSRVPLDAYPTMIRSSATVLAMVTFIMASGMGARTRLLWLRSGDSRAQLFRVGERSMLLNLSIVSGAAWLAVTGLGLRRGLQIAVPEALTMLVAIALSALAALYAGMARPTLYSPGLRAAGFVVWLVAIAFVPIAWIVA
jgi:hypothetical protein